MPLPTLVVLLMGLALLLALAETQPIAPAWRAAIRVLVVLTMVGLVLVAGLR